MALQFTENRQRNIGLSLTSNPRTVLRSNGIVEATQAEAVAGTIQTRYISPLRLADVLATGAGVVDGDKGDVVVTGSGTIWTIDPVTGTGSFVRATSPTLVTPTLGVASATSINKVALTAPATSATLTIADGKTFTVSNTLTFTGTDASSVAFGTGGTVAYTGATLAQFAATTSAQLAGVISDETGSDALVFANTPTLVTPILGTPTSGTLTNCTGLPVGGVSGLGTGVATALAVNVGSAGAFVAQNGALGTPSSGTLTNCTGYTVANLSGAGAGVLTFLATPSSANLISAVTDETGSGALVFANTPTLVTPILGTPTSGTLTNCTGLPTSGISGLFGKQSVWIPASAMVSRTTNGAAPGVIEMTTNKNMVVTLDFDTTTQEFAQFDIRMPKSWNESTVTFIPVWSHPSTVTNFGVVWGLDAVAISDDDALDVAFGTEQTSTDTGGTTNDLYQGPESSAITVSGTPAAGDLVQFRIHRNPASGSDTLAVDARLHGVLLLYTTDATNDT